MYRITKKSINKNTHACTLYISNTFVERSQATGNIYNLVFSCPYTIKTLLKSKGTDTFNTAVEAV